MLSLFNIQYLTHWQYKTIGKIFAPYLINMLKYIIGEEENLTKESQLRLWYMNGPQARPRPN